MTPAIVFDDAKGQLSPLNDLRASFEVRTGALTTLERLVRALELAPVALVAPAAIAGLVRERHAAPLNEAPAGNGAVLAINGRCPLPYEIIASLEPGRCIVERGTGDLVAAYLEPGRAAGFVKSGAHGAAPAGELDAPALLSRPWHARTFRDRALGVDLELLGASPTQELPPGVLAFGESPFTIDPTALLYPSVTLDLEHGAVVIDAEAVVRPGAIIAGPAYVGRHATVLDRAIIRPNTAIGPWCKVGGEVGGTIFQGYSNKAHDGHLGDSWIGEWVNLGAGTTNSNLLNTYGGVIARATPGSPNERTGETFLGCILGDHVKTAICTRIMTGCVVHTGAMIATTSAAAGCIGPFTWATDAGVRPYLFDKFVEVAGAVMARRSMTPSGAYLARLEALSRAGA